MVGLIGFHFLSRSSPDTHMHIRTAAEPETCRPSGAGTYGALAVSALAPTALAVTALAPTALAVSVLAVCV